MMMVLWILAAGEALWASYGVSQAAEPDVAADPGKPLSCETPAEIKGGQPLVLRCTARPKNNVPVVVLLHYRPAGQEAFTTAPTLRTPKGWYTASICADSLGPGPVHYYVEALDSRDQVVAASGEPASPHILSVVGGRARRRTVVSLPDDSPSPAGEAAIDSDDPLAHIRAEREAARTSAEAVGRRPPGRPFLGLGIGWGYGWHPAGALDFRRDLRASGGTAPAGRVVLNPEIGYQLNDAISLSVQGRVQLIGASGSGDGTLGAPARGAWAVLGRGSYHFGTGRAQLVASAAFGAGQGFRLVVEPQPQAGLFRNDSVAAGPLVMGPGLGAIYHLGQHAAVVADLRMFAGLPRFATVVDLSSGIAIAF
jgi:hypothetical protein